MMDQIITNPPIIDGEENQNEERKKERKKEDGTDDLGGLSVGGDQFLGPIGHQLHRVGHVLGHQDAQLGVHRRHHALAADNNNNNNKKSENPLTRRRPDCVAVAGGYL